MRIDNLRITKDHGELKLSFQADPEDIDRVIEATKVRVAEIFSPGPWCGGDYEDGCFGYADYDALGWIGACHELGGIYINLWPRAMEHDLDYTQYCNSMEVKPDEWIEFLPSMKFLKNILQKGE
jgi:hypothetical protein